MGGANEVRTVRLPSGEAVAALGQGTWRMGEEAGRRAEEIAALRRGIELGLTLVDTAEMYGEGATETLVGEALAGIRDQTFLVSKAYPQNAGRTALPKACERSLARLRTDRIDLYLLHWRGSVPLAETVKAMERLREAGKIRHWGVSNLDLDDMEELVEAGGSACATNQILYNAGRRGPEHDLLPWMSAQGIPAMAYSPVEQGRLAKAKALAGIARRHDTSPAAVALAWVLRRPDVIAIPKAGTRAHVEENGRALDLALTDDDLTEIDRAYPAPRRKVALEML
ncbi:aldo/keto reductase [uncultured Enterovirga sp.]|uniref:aldo/keto reductase n=1 Tax=uncultured Enterovirga sp. TaxID=2026352 RepID=UPI0035CB728F